MFSWFTGSEETKTDNNNDPNTTTTTTTTITATLSTTTTTTTDPVKPVIIKKDINDYQTQINETIQILNFEGANEKDWEIVSEQKGIKIFLKNVEENPIKSAKAHGIIKQSPQAIITVIEDLITYKEVDKMFQEGKVVEHFNELNEIIYSLYSSGYMLVANRDFCYFENRKKDPDGTITISCFSVEHPDCPEVDSVVRGHIFFSGWLLRPIKPTGTPEKVLKHANETWTETVFLAQVDPKGWLPIYLINQASQEVGSSIQNIRDFFKNKKAQQKQQQQQSNQATSEVANTTTTTPAAESNSSSWFW